jgi:flagellar capping protein FliD
MGGPPMASGGHLPGGPGGGLMFASGDTLLLPSVKTEGPTVAEISVWSEDRRVIVGTNNKDAVSRAQAWLEALQNESKNPDEKSKWNVEDLERASRSIADVLRTAARDATSDDDAAELKKGLRQLLERSFKARLEQQTAELNAAQAELDQAKARLQKRAEKQQEIIERRFKELLGDDETKW